MPKVIYTHTEQSDAVIKECYATGGHGFLKRAAERIRMEYGAVYRRAEKLGLTKLTKPDTIWTDAELAILERNAHKQAATITRILARGGYHRSANAVSVKLRRMDISKKEEQEGRGLYSVDKLAQCMGVSPAVVRRYVNLGYLKASMKGTQRVEAQHGDTKIIKSADIREFLIKYTAHINHAKCDKFWLFDILSGESNAKG